VVTLVVLVFVELPVTDVDVARWYAELVWLRGRIGVRVRRMQPCRRARQAKNEAGLDE
jgi:hypothetical protein